MRRLALLAALAVCCAAVLGAARADGETAPPLTPGHYVGLIENGTTGEGGPLALDLRAASTTVRGLTGVLNAAGREFPVSVSFTSADTFTGSGRTPAASIDFRGTSVDWFDRADFRLAGEVAVTTGRMLFFRTFDDWKAPTLPVKWEGPDVDAVLAIGGQSGNEFRGGLGIGRARFPLVGSIGAPGTDGVAPVHAVGLGDAGALTLNGRLARSTTGFRLTCEVTVALADGSVRNVRFVLLPAAQ